MTYQLDAYQGTTQFLFSTVPVHTVEADGAPGSATAFVFRDPRGDYLVTNRHVLEGIRSVTFTFHSGPAAEMRNFTVAQRRVFELANPLQHWECHPTCDLCAVSLPKLRRLANRALDDVWSFPIHSSAIPEDADIMRYPAVMTVVMIGYPNGLWDQENNLPVARRGTTASHPAVDFNGKPEVVVDMACFAGSSGSPVMFHDAAYFGSANRFLGVLYAGPVMSQKGEVTVEPVPTTQRLVALTPTMIHLGYVIKAREVAKLVAVCEPS